MLGTESITQGDIVPGKATEVSAQSTTAQGIVIELPVNKKSTDVSLKTQQHNKTECCIPIVCLLCVYLAFSCPVEKTDCCNMICCSCTCKCCDCCDSRGNNTYICFNSNGSNNDTCCCCCDCSGCGNFLDGLCNCLFCCCQIEC